MNNMEIVFMLMFLVFSITIEIMSISMMLDIYKFKKMISRDHEEIAEALLRMQKARFKEVIENSDIKAEQKKYQKKLNNFKEWEKHIPTID
jgi:uncharacterized protein YqiB (DUF1249 family)